MLRCCCGDGEPLARPQDPSVGRARLAVPDIAVIIAVIISVGNTSSSTTPRSRQPSPMQGLTPTEAAEAAHLRRLMARERAVRNCIAIARNPCDCTAQAVEFVRAMQNENRMSMTRRRRLNASQELAEMCLAVEEGVSLSDMLRQ